MNKKTVFIIETFFVVIFALLLILTSRYKASSTSKTTVHPEYKITPIIAPFIEIKITDKGFFPNEVTTDKKHLIHFINQTNKITEVIQSESKVILAPIKPRKIGISFPFEKTGEYIFYLNDNPSLKVRVTIN